MVVVVVVLDEEGAAKGTLLGGRVEYRRPQQSFVQHKVVCVHGTVEHHRDDLERRAKENLSVNSIISQHKFPFFCF